MRKMVAEIAATAALVSMVGGCSFLSNLLGSQTTTVRLVNNGDFPIHVTVVYGSDQNALESVLKQVGTAQEFDIAAGQSTSFSRNCNDLQAVLIEKAELNLVGSIGPETSSRVQRDGSDFGCGDTIRFTFDHGPLIVDFDVAVSVSSQSSLS